MIRILVTGANGQLGRCLKKAVDQQLFKHYQFVFVNKDQLNLADSSLIESFFFSNQFDFCINCAAYTKVDEAETEVELAFKINADAVETLARECKEQGTKLIHISTDYVFDGHANTPYSEDDQVNPQSVYGKSKLEGERLAQDILPEVLIIRTAWVYSQFGNNFVKTMLRLMKQGKNLQVVNDQIGAPTNAYDLAKTILHIILHYPKASGLYHYSNQGKISWFDFAKVIAEIKTFKNTITPILTKDYPTPAKRPLYSLLDTSKIQADFNLEIPDWKESLERHLTLHETF